MLAINAAYAVMFKLGQVNDDVGIYMVILLYLCTLTNVYTVLGWF